MSEHDRLLLEHQIGDEVMLRGELHVIDISDVDERRFLRRVTSPQKAA